MTTETMTIHEALAELKTLESRVYKALSNATFVQTKVHADKKIKGADIAEVTKDMDAKYQQISDLIKRETAIRKAVSNSNAVTTVTVGDVTYTVAEAIAMKKLGVEHKQLLLKQLERQYSNCQSTVISNNSEKLSRAADNYVASSFASCTTPSEEDKAKARLKYIEDNSTEIFDPLKVQAIITKLEEEIAAFSTKIDSALSTSNAITTIMIEY